MSFMQSFQKLLSSQVTLPFSEADSPQGMSLVCHKNKTNPAGNTVPGKVERTIGESLAMSCYVACPQKMLRPGFAVSLSSRFIWFSLGTTSPHTAFDLVKMGESQPSFCCCCYCLSLDRASGVLINYSPLEVLLIHSIGWHHSS